MVRLAQPALLLVFVANTLRIFRGLQHRAQCVESTQQTLPAFKGLLMPIHLLAHSPALLTNGYITCQA